MSDAMKVQPFEVLLKWMLQEYEENRSIFGIPRSLFYIPQKDHPYATGDLFGHYLATPIGPAAGPHTQLAQNILCAWLSGGRFMELKTVQIMDELEISRPCIDMADEGYNVEWSQELKLDQSVQEYIKAWVLIHILHRLLGFDQLPVGTIFNMSVGYNLEGIQSLPMTRFMDRLADASEEIGHMREMLRARFPRFAEIPVPARITNNVTLSTMHGCPPEEIERIARYLMEERGLHTIVKLNPTLLGKERVLAILHDHLGFHEINIPDQVFEHDLDYGRAVEMIKRLRHTAIERNLTFGVKLSNTLAMENHKGVFTGNEMYMSGRALYPITMNLFHQLAREFDGDLPVSYSAGADALNVTAILAAGARPVTVASDLLKPGGYSRLLQYLESLDTEMSNRGAANLAELTRDKLTNLEQAAAEALADPRYKKAYHPHGLPKVESGLESFDCITAPCVGKCGLCQDVPGYARLIARGDDDRALEVILDRNPLPAVSGYMCTHLCQTCCTRNNYDQPVAIRALKRFAAEQGQVTLPVREKSNRRVAVIGSGPAGLAAAFYLALNGVQATIFEAKDRAGGMPALAPAFRIPPAVVQEDIDRIKGLGVEIKLSHPITTPPEELLKEGFDAVYLACGFPKDARLNIEGMEGKGIFSALDLLDQVARGEKPDLGSRVLVIGGGNTAMDAARTARRLTGNPATVVYRRTAQEMPAAREEVEELLAEGNVLEELVSPIRVILRDGRVSGLECLRNKLGEPDADGRRKPVPIEGSGFVLEADAIVVAVGQSPDLTFLDGSSLSLHQNGAIAVDPQTGQAGTPGVYAGGDAVRGPAIVIQACADGRRAAEAICGSFGIHFETLVSPQRGLSEEEILQAKRARTRKEARHQPEMLPMTERTGFDLVEGTLREEAARAEAARCMQCSAFCDKCVEVCPNRANYTYLTPPVHVMLPLLYCQDGELAVTGEEPFRIEQTRQIIHLDDFCNECGNCATFCVHQGKPYQDKPRLFLKESDFVQENDNAFYMEGNTIRRREKGVESKLSLVNNGWDFESKLVRISMSDDFVIKEMALKKAFEGALSLREAAEMAVIFRGITNTLSFLL
ncbi:putative selenate reductase subunit YgfK [Candidatus Formimonas warabiya]|nr:putative selenate reductase subunit YgfK [Candidatus Formimonas warabiya]